MIRIQKQRLYPTVTCRLTGRLKQTIEYVIVQKSDTFPESFITWTSWNNQKFWTINKRKFSALQVFQPFSHKSKNLFLRSCPNEFIRCLCDYIVKNRKGNWQSIKRLHVTKIHSEIWLFAPKKFTWKQRRDVLASGKRLQLTKVITPPVFNHLSWHETICPRFGASVYNNKSLISHTFTKQDLPKYQDEQNPTYQIVSLKNENKQKVPKQTV